MKEKNQFEYKYLIEDQNQKLQEKLHIITQEHLSVYLPQLKTAAALLARQNKHSLLSHLFELHNSFKEMHAKTFYDSVLIKRQVHLLIKQRTWPNFELIVDSYFKKQINLNKKPVFIAFIGKKPVRALLRIQSTFYRLHSPISK